MPAENDHLVPRLLKPQEEGQLDMVIQRRPGLEELLCRTDHSIDGPVGHLPQPPLSASHKQLCQSLSGKSWPDKVPKRTEKAHTADEF